MDLKEKRKHRKRKTPRPIVMESDLKVSGFGPNLQAYIRAKFQKPKKRK